MNYMINNESKFIITKNDESADLLLKTGFKLLKQDGDQWIFLNDAKMLFNNLSGLVYTNTLCI
nr:MAG TPA: hypothetical protein [Caudoviricetes sp.]